jgi:hypothetical protein
MTYTVTVDTATDGAFYRIKDTGGKVVAYGYKLASERVAFESALDALIKGSK